MTLFTTNLPWLKWSAHTQNIFITGKHAFAHSSSVSCTQTHNGSDRDPRRPRVASPGASMPAPEHRHSLTPSLRGHAHFHSQHVRNNTRKFTSPLSPLKQQQTKDKMMMKNLQQIKMFNTIAFKRPSRRPT